jgi:hypothetical protein
VILVTVPVVDAGNEEPRVETGPATNALSWTWTAPWLDRTYNLTDLTSPVLKLRGATGTGQADPTHWWSEAPTIDGSEWEGSRTGRGSVFLPLQVTGFDTADFMTNHDAFVATLDPKREGLIRVTRPDGTWREASCRYESGADLPITLDPVMACRAVYGITWATADPYWRGEEIIARFENETPPPFFPFPPLVLASGQSLANAPVTNPGEVAAYPVWRIEGPFSSFSVGVGDSLAEMTLAKVTGQWVEIDMNPRRGTFRDETGADVGDYVTEWNFEAIPPGTTQLTTVVNGSGVDTAVTLTFTPRYRRAW